MITVYDHGIYATITILLKKNVITNKKTPQGLDSFYILAQTPIKQNENEQNQLFIEDTKFENFMVTLKQNKNSPNQNNIKTNNAHTLAQP